MAGGKSTTLASTFRYTLALACLALLVGGCGAKNSTGDSNIPGMGSFDFTIASGRAQLSVVFTALKIDTGVRVPIPGILDGFIEIGPDFNSGGTIFTASVLLTSLMSGYDKLPLFGLPDGRPIPGVRRGALPSRIVQLPLFGNSLLYQSQDLFGLFLPIDFGQFPLNVTTRMRDQYGNLVGVLTAVAKGGPKGISGALFLFPVEGSSSQQTILASLR